MYIHFIILLLTFLVCLDVYRHDYYDGRWVGMEEMFRVYLSICAAYILLYNVVVKPIYRKIQQHKINKKIPIIPLEDFLSKYQGMNVEYNNGKIENFVFHKQDNSQLKVRCSHEISHYTTQQLQDEKKHLSIVTMKSGEYRIKRVWTDKLQ